MGIQSELRLGDTAQALNSYVTNFQASRSIENVKAALAAGHVTPFLGAGASAAMGFPKWDDLIDGLLNELVGAPSLSSSADLAQSARQVGRTSLTLVRVLEALVKLPSALRISLRNRLYERYDDSDASEFIQPFVETLLVAGRCDQVVTYNFDNSLERFLLKHGISHSVAYSEATYRKVDGVQIYHPHGYLPHPEDGDDSLSESAIFSEREYNRIFMDSAHWSNVVQVHHMLHSRCLFLGLSMSDPNLRKHLDYARARGGAGRRHWTVQRSTGDKVLDFLMDLDMKSLGVEVIWIEDYPDMPLFFSRLL